ncbi:MAG: ATPase domain-containing protein [Pyrinomonadaceae bacterium]
MPKTLRFGIESLDKLLGPNECDHGLHIEKSDRKADAENGKKSVVDDGKEVVADGDKKSSGIGPTTSICLTGPDGTGKSVLALHLAARYMTDCREEQKDRDVLPKVFYISTDLTYSMAHKIWGNFDLYRPSLRKEPFGVNQPLRLRDQDGNPTKDGARLNPVGDPLELCDRTPGEMSCVLAGGDEFEVYFVDLAQTTAGDDWGFVHRLLSVLTPRSEPNAPRDLVLLDAVEGFETLVGDINAFGDKSTRRSRIAQVMRLAANKCHLLFVVEEVKNERLPEEFVTDAVIRLRNVESNGYIRRTVEVEKTRGQTHTRGQHPFVIRDGRGSTTGNMKYENHDDPRVLKYGVVLKADTEAEANDGETQSYVHVFPSINNLSRELMEQRGEPKNEPPPNKYAAFGIPYLDTMLGGDGELRPEDDGSDTRGLPCSSVTALIGDALTQKGVLGRAFLSRTFYSFARTLAKRVNEEPPEYLARAQAEGVDKFRQYIKQMGDELLKDEEVRKKLGVALLMTTQDTHVETLSKEFIRWLNPKSLLGSMGGDVADMFVEVLKGFIEKRTICRRMEVHDVSSPVLAHIFRRNIQAAQSMLLGRSVEGMKTSGRYKESWRIRMVIDDFNAFRNTFPDMHNDPLLVPFILFNLGREGISTLVIDTQSGKPDIALAERFESSLREAADYRLYTWRIPFYGETRIAITAIPPISTNSRGLIRELSGQGMHGYMQAEAQREDRQLTVDPHFELYAGLERGLPHPVPLEIRLYTGSHALVKYIEEENVFFRELFVPNPPKQDIIVGFDPPNYESLREFCYLQRDTRLDYTLVFQVDEFWVTWLTRQSRMRKGGVLQQQWPYLNTITVDHNGDPDPAADAYHLFQKTYDDLKLRAGKKDGKDVEDAATKSARESRRRDFYDDERLEYGFGEAFDDKQPAAGIGDADEEKGHPFDEIDRVPFHWDFAFMLCRENLWNEYLKMEKSSNQLKKYKNKLEKYKNVEEVWNNIKKAKSESDGDKKAAGKRGGHQKLISWFDFFKACKEVAEYHSARTSTHIPAFDFTTSDGESFSCLFLELWASETYDTRKVLKGGEDAFDFAQALSTKVWKRQQGREEKSRTPPHVGNVPAKGGKREQVHESMSLLRALEREQGQTLSALLRQRKEGEGESRVPGYSIELYKAWLLLTEVMSFEELVSTPSNLSFDFKPRQSNPQAVAAHHWYQSACDLIDQTGSSESLVAVRLPGHFSVRGDWFLGVAGGSRSGRLAHRAFDLLSSRRANIKRLQLGLGLPVRKIVHDEKNFDKVRTRLIATDHKTGRLDNVTYKDFLEIKGRTLKGKFGQDEGEEFYWLWRSSLYGYARYSRVWQKWLNRMANWWHTIYTRHKTGWTPGFEVYQKINEYRASQEAKIVELEKYESWREFDNYRDILLQELQQVSFGSG